MERNLPVKRGPRQATVASLVAAMAVVLASAGGLAAGPGRYALSQSVLVSSGADAIVALVLLVVLTLALRGSLTALLLWPGTCCGPEPCSI